MFAAELSTSCQRRDTFTFARWLVSLGPERDEPAESAHQPSLVAQVALSAASRRKLRAMTAVPSPSVSFQTDGLEGAAALTSSQVG